MGLQAAIVSILSLINLLVMLWNFLMAPDKFYGKHPAIFKTLKPLIAPLMLLHFYLGMETVPSTLVSFSIFCWLGDIALLWTSYLANSIGGVCFLFAQLSIIAFYNVPLDRTSPLALFLFLPSTCVLVFYLFPLIIGHRPEYITAVGYLLSLNAALASAVQRCVVMKALSSPYILGFIGHQLFVVSDVVLVRGMMLKIENTQNFTVILTYVLALWFISLSITIAPPVVAPPTASPINDEM